MNTPLAQVAKVNPKSELPDHYLGGEMLDFVPMADVSESGVVTVTCQRPLADVQKGFTAFRKGDILVAKITPCFENNKIAIADIATPFGFGSTEFHVVRCDPSEIDSRYLLHFLRSNVVRDEGKKRMTGSAGQQRVPKTFLEELKVPVLSLTQQKRIAAILDQADELRRKRQRAVEKLNQLGQSIFIEMFGDPRTNPNGWDAVRLGDLCDVGSSKRVFVNEFVERGVPFYRGTEVGKLGAGEEINAGLFIAPSHYDDLVSHSGKPEIGDLLLPSICHDGRIWKVDSPEPFYFKDGRVLWIKSHQAAIDSEYLRRYLQNRFVFDYASIASGTTFAELKIFSLKNLTILCPPIELQAAFSKWVTAIESIYPVHHRSQVVVDALFSSLQHRAFRREL